MKKIYYIFLILFSGILFTACEDDADIYQIDEGQTLAVFDSYKSGLGGLADGTEYDKEIKVKITGPGIADLSGDITITVGADETSTAIEGTHYRIANKTITLTKKNSYLGIIDLVLVTEGNTPPLDDDPAFKDYKAPVLNLNIVSATGGVTPTGKSNALTLNYTPPNPYAGLYDVELRYFHPSAGGSHPSLGDAFDPNDPYGGIRELEKELIAVTGRKVETGFAVWGDDSDPKLEWITINPDNSIAFEVSENWDYDVELGNPFDGTQVSHYDPDSGKIYLYYHYYGTGGARIFWEVFTPKAK